MKNSAASDGPRRFIAMEYISGETLHETIQKGPLQLTEAVNVASQVAEALKAAHAKKIVHRDIKSANVMLTDDGVAKVLDFGRAKTNQSTMLTRLGSILGTVAYMSPEQARGLEVDGRSDLYSLGTILHEMICGCLLFAGDYEQAVVYGILNEPLNSVRTGVPMGLEWIVNKLPAKEPDYRYQTAADLPADLRTVEGIKLRHSNDMEKSEFLTGGDSRELFFFPVFPDQFPQNTISLHFGTPGSFIDMIDGLPVIAGNPNAVQVELRA